MTEITPYYSSGPQLDKEKVAKNVWFKGGVNYHERFKYLMFGQGMPKSTSQGCILAMLPLATFQLFNSLSIDKYHWKEHIILR
jgi:hypothetical protein